MAVFAVVLAVASAGRAAAQTGGSEPCQVWVDALEVHKARQAARPDYPQWHIDIAEKNLLACTARDTDTYWPSGPGRGTLKASTGLTRQPATPTSQQVQRFTYSPAENPYRGWIASGSHRENCFRNWRTGETYEQWATRCQAGTIRPRTTPSNASVTEQAEKTRIGRDRAEAIEGRQIDWYDPPVGGGPNGGAVRVPCTPGGNTYVRDANAREAHHAKDPWVDSGSPPPPGQVCH